jgi:2-dehydro-3-deoxyphosphogluconate aldolase / (4S)-4-hydroxy-2-oxoglutarate aldolase
MDRQFSTGIFAADAPFRLAAYVASMPFRQEEPPMHPIFRGVSVIPVLTIDRTADAVPLARALFEGGLAVIEVTLRTPAAPAAIAAIARELPHIVVGAGTLQRASDVAEAVHAGARFLVSPGTIPELAAAALATELPYLPGVATPSEIMAARALGVCVMKFFPAEALSGAAMLRALAPVFPGVAFCPTGGIDERSAEEYLALPNVPVVGGSWMAPKDAIQAGDWGRVRRLAERASAIGQRQAA